MNRLGCFLDGVLLYAGIVSIVDLCLGKQEQNRSEETKNQQKGLCADQQAVKKSSYKARVLRDGLTGVDDEPILS